MLRPPRKFLSELQIAYDLIFEGAFPPEGHCHVNTVSLAIETSPSCVISKVLGVGTIAVAGIVQKIETRVTLGTIKWVLGTTEALGIAAYAGIRSVPIIIFWKVAVSAVRDAGSAEFEVRNVRSCCIAGRTIFGT